MDDQNFPSLPEETTRALSVDRNNDPFLNW
jgi:hypothetical protein